jgi:hypothetical protein
VTFWDRLFRRSRRGDPSQYIPPQQTYVDPGSTAPPADPDSERGHDDPASYDDPGEPGDAGGGDGGGGDGGGGGNGGGGGD